MKKYRRNFRMLYEERNGMGDAKDLTSGEYEKFLVNMEKTVGGALLRLGEELRGFALAVKREINR